MFFYQRCSFVVELLLCRGLHAREDQHGIRQSLSFDLDRSNGRIKLSDLAGSKLNVICTTVLDRVRATRSVLLIRVLDDYRQVLGVGLGSGRMSVVN